MDKNACYNVTKLNVAKIFSPDENQNKDAWQFDFRLYHDTFVLDNKVKGIYAHTAAQEVTMKMTKDGITREVEECEVAKFKEMGFIAQEPEPQPQQEES